MALATLPKMRVLDDAHAELLAEDPGCALTKSALRRLVLSGQVRSVMIGRKRLIDMGSVKAYLAGDIPATVAAEPKAAGIRRIGG
ncbi:MAG: hypothetical protein ACI3V0_08550 [Faecousia sp.]